MSLQKKLNDIDLTLQMGKIESGRDDIVYYSVEDEYLLLVFARFFSL